jgi:hypothetical protein
MFAMLKAKRHASSCDFTPTIWDCCDASANQLVVSASNNLSDDHKNPQSILVVVKSSMKSLAMKCAFLLRRVSQNN